MKTIAEKTNAQIVEKKSKFICDLFYVSSIQEAEEKIQNVRKIYHDARHHCFAYRIEAKDAIIQEKSSDDGEPAGTAGAPILNLLSKYELSNCLAVVTRYFGGILLGTGGLVRAYSEVTKIAIQKAKIVVQKLRFRSKSNNFL